MSSRLITAGNPEYPYPRPTVAGLSVLLGVPPELIAAHLDRENSLPAEWLRAGRRRQGEAAAHTGSSDVVSALQFWAQRDLGRRVVVLGDEVIV